MSNILEQVDTVKRIVEKTLEKRDEVARKIKALQKEKEILDADISDLKDGKIDRIVERQEKDPKAKETSVVVIIKEKEVIREVSPWYWPYRVVWQDVYKPTYYDNTWRFQDNGTSGGYNFPTMTTGTITCSVAKDSVPGTYMVGTNAVYLR